MFKAEAVYKAIKGDNGGYVYFTIDENDRTDEIIVLVDSPVLETARKVFRFNEAGLCYTTGGHANGTWTTIIDSNGKVNAPALTGILADAAGKNSWNLTSGAMALASDVTFGGKSIPAIVGELMPDVSAAISSALESYDASLDQDTVLGKLTDGGVDTGLYIGSDGLLLHMLPERVVSGGANIPAAYLPTTIVNGEVTSFVQVRVANGIIYPPFTHTITYYDEDGETIIGTEQVVSGHSCQSAPQPSKEGYTFTGWADSMGGAADAALLENITADNDLYAVYEAGE